MQVRTSRQTHVDIEYCKMFFKYFNGITTELTNVLSKVNSGMIVGFVSIDDKSNIDM